MWKIYSRFPGSKKFNSFSIVSYKQEMRKSLLQSPVTEKKQTVFERNINMSILSIGYNAHSCMPSPLAIDPISVQSCVFVYSEPIEIVWL